MPTREFNPAGCSGSRYFLVHPGAGGSAEVYRFRFAVGDGEPYGNTSTIPANTHASGSR